MAQTCPLVCAPQLRAGVISRQLPEGCASQLSRAAATHARAMRSVRVRTCAVASSSSGSSNGASRELGHHEPDSVHVRKSTPVDADPSDPGKHIPVSYIKPVRHVRGSRFSGRKYRKLDDDDEERAEKARVEIDFDNEDVKRAARRGIKNLQYEGVLAELQNELVVLQEYIKAKGLKVCVLFEGRDAAGKGGCISRITQAMSPRITRVVALSAPSEKEKTQWYFQRYVRHLPSAGEMVLFDRSWYNRAGVERVMGFCTEDEYEEFMRSVGLFEEMLVNSGVILIKLWFDVSDKEQERRFHLRAGRYWKRWKLSPMDLQARTRWYEYGKARDDMFRRTSHPVKWAVVPSDNKKISRLNAIDHILASIDYDEIPWDPVSIPPRGANMLEDYEPPSEFDPECVKMVSQVYTRDTLRLRVAAATGGGADGEDDGGYGDDERSLYGWADAYDGENGDAMFDMSDEDDDEELEYEDMTSQIMRSSR